MSATTTKTAAPATKIIEVAVQKVYTEARHNCYLFRVPADTDEKAFESAISDHADDLWENQVDQGESICGGTLLGEYESETHTDEFQEPWVCEVDRPQTIPGDVHVFLLKELVEGFVLSDLEEDDEAEVRKYEEFRAAVKKLASELDSQRGTDEWRQGYKEFVLLEAFTKNTSYKDFLDKPVHVISDYLSGEYEQVKQIFGIDFVRTATVKKPGEKF